MDYDSLRVQGSGGGPGVGTAVGVETAVGVDVADGDVTRVVDGDRPLDAPPRCRAGSPRHPNDGPPNADHHNAA